MHKLWGVLLLSAALVAPVAPAVAMGAIAVDDEAGTKADEVGYGIGYGDTQDEAAGEAAGACISAGNTNCTIVSVFRGCGAYAASPTHFGVGQGDTPEAAINDALDQCGDGCRVVVSDCE